MELLRFLRLASPRSVAGFIFDDSLLRHRPSCCLDYVLHLSRWRSSVCSMSRTCLLGLLQKHQEFELLVRLRGDPDVLAFCIFLGDFDSDLRAWVFSLFDSELQHARGRNDVPPAQCRTEGDLRAHIEHFSVEDLDLVSPGPPCYRFWHYGEESDAAIDVFFLDLVGWMQATNSSGGSDHLWSSMCRLLA